MTRSLLKTTTLLCGAAFGCTTLLASPAVAQTAGSDIDLIQKQIHDLQTQLNRLKHELTTREDRIRAAEEQAKQARIQAQAAQQQAEDAQRAAQGIPLSRPPGLAPVYAPASPGQPFVQLGVQAPSNVPPNLQETLPGPHPYYTAGAQAASTQPPMGTFRLGGVTVTLGGFLAAESVWRERNEVADIGSNYNTAIPFPNSPLYHENEFRGSARQSRISLLMQGDASPSIHLAGYFETDFLGTGPTSNSNESNSYTLRLRQAYMTADQNDWGLHFLGGQAWSLLTLNRVGITPRQENIPLTIDAQYVVGFTWARQWQLRLDKDFLDHRLWFGISVEEPQTVFSVGPNGALPTGFGTVNDENPGGSLLPPNQNFSDDILPDLVAKVAFDPGWGHYELDGVLRAMHDRVSFTNAGTNHTTLGWGGGGGFILPLVPAKLDFQGSALAGYGIGRYGSAQLPDATIGPNGAPEPLPEVMALTGLVGHPSPLLDIYAYAGVEQEWARFFNAGGKGFGYGSPLFDNAGCQTELAAASTCVANTSGVAMGTLGFWWRFFKGSFGTMQFGAQYSYLRRNIFPGAGAVKGTLASPSTNQNMVLTSFRYLPFQ
jgi:hypothetical protein